MIMDNVFNDLDRTNILCYLMHNFASTYICLWSYLPNGCLYLKDGGYRSEEANQPSTSSGSQASTLFHQYRQQVFVLRQNDLVPGFAFQNNLPYLEINELNLIRMASSDIQRQFYQEARIKKAVFMGCKSGEIELGFSHVNAPINVEMEMRSLFPEDFSRHSPPVASGDPLNINPHNSSSPSSFRSLSTETETAPIALSPIITTTTTMSATNQHQSQQLPTPESEQAAMIRAILAVLSSPSSSLPQQQLNPQNIQLSPFQQNTKATAFERYTRPSSTDTTNHYLVRPNMLKRSISYFRNLHVVRMHEHALANRPSSNQFHHVISERKRREKLNDSFQALRALLPPGSKKDKASVLAGAREYLASLKAQVEEMSERNRILEANLMAANKESELKIDDDDEGANSQERVDVEIGHVVESTSSEEGLMVELRVIVRREMAAVEVVVRILEFLKEVNNVSFVSMEANRRTTDSTAVNRVNMRLKIQGTGWDESGFREAVKRVFNG